MSKQYTVDMNIDVSGCTPNGGFLMKQALKEADPKQPDAIVDARGFKERTGSEVFVLLAAAAINGANPKCGYNQLKGFRHTIKELNDAEKTGSLTTNKTSIDLIKNSIKGNPNWPNTDEIYLVLDQMMERLNEAPEA